ncbi:MAG: hypothetical protein WCI76_00660 [bacterium]
MTKKIFIIITLIAMLVGGVIYAENAGLIDVFSNPDTHLAKDFAKIAVFPESIGTYVRTESFVSVQDECTDLAKSSDSASKGLSGTVCTRIATAMYKDDAAKKSVFVHFAKVTEGKEPYVLYMKAFSKPDKIDQYEVIRIEDHELGWFPQDVFDVLVTQEGQFTLNSDGGMSMSYGKATGQNAVSQYFLNKYPPVKESDPTGNTTIDGTYPVSSNYQFYSIHDLKKSNLSSGLYDTEGYVVKKYECSSGISKPCMRNNVVISEHNIPLEKYNLSDDELIIFLDNSKKLELGKKYRFSIRLLDSKTTDEIINDAELVGFNTL